MKTLTMYSGNYKFKKIPELENFAHFGFCYNTSYVRITVRLTQSRDNCLNK